MAVLLTKCRAIWRRGLHVGGVRWSSVVPQVATQPKRNSAKRLMWAKLDPPMVLREAKEVMRLLGESRRKEKRKQRVLVSHLAHALVQFCKKGGKSSEPILYDVYYALATHSSSLSTRNLAAVLVHLRRLKVVDHQVWGRICTSFAEQAGDCDARDLANVLNAITRHGYHDRDVVSKLAAEIPRLSKGLSSGAIATALHALAKFDHYDASVVRDLCQSAAAKATDFSAQHVANTMDALARFDHFDEAVTKTLCTWVGERAGELSSHRIAYFLDGLVKLGHFDKAAVARLCQEAVLKASDFTPQCISITLNALVRLRYVDKAVFDALRVQAEQKVVACDVFDAQYMASTVHVLAISGCTDKAVLTTLCAKVSNTPGDLTTQDLVNTFNVLLKVDYDEQMVAKLCAEVVNKANDFRARDIANILHVLAQLDHFDEPVLLALSQEDAGQNTFPGDFLPHNILETMDKFEFSDETACEKLKSWLEQV